MAGRLCTTAKYRAGHARLNRELIARRIARGYCEVTGIKFDLGVHELRPSLDRIKAGGAYTTRNVRVTLWAWNRFRGNMDSENAVVLLKRMARMARIVSSSDTKIFQNGDG